MVGFRYGHPSKTTTTTKKKKRKKRIILGRNPGLIVMVVVLVMTRRIAVKHPLKRSTGAAASPWTTTGHSIRPTSYGCSRSSAKGPGKELPYIKFHGLRHSAASLMLASGADIAMVSKLLGHASITITADVYGHLVGTVASDAGNGAANLITRTSLAHEDVSG